MFNSIATTKVFVAHFQTTITGKTGLVKFNKKGERFVEKLSVVNLRKNIFVKVRNAQIIINNENIVLRLRIFEFREPRELQPFGVNFINGRRLIS